MVTRITGLASGMDIDSIVKNLMKAERAPLNKLNQQKQLMEWKREGYRETSTKLVSFLQDKLSKLSSNAVLNAQSAKITGDTSAVTAVASSSASGVLDVKVNKLATTSTAVSDSAAWKTIGAGKTTMGDFGFADGKVRIGMDEIDVQATDTVEVFVAKINTSKTAGVTAIYDPENGLSLSSKSTGKANSFVTASTATADSTMIIADDIVNKFKLKLTDGEDAEAVINGLTVKKSSNTFDVNGIMLTLNSATPTGGVAAHIEVTKNTEKIVEAVQSFVDAYNDLLSSLNSKVREERYRKYSPLSDEERSAMSDDEAKLWTDKAKSGMLKNDSILQQTITDMRTAIIQGVDIGRTVKENGVDVNKPLMLTELGITTGVYQTNGKLELDVEKLKQALDKDPSIVSSFFGQNYSAAFSDNEYKPTDGVFAKMLKISNAALEQMTQTAGTSKVSKDLTAAFQSNSTMGTELTNLDRRISEMVAKLNRIETNYFKRFTAMETAMNKYNSTASSLFGMS
ncbi:flagellar filament capping protein FliD [Paenibacillus sp. Marseille-P2973]|uniref:flagellar filament capping protein FliD n=1 Tax=Paenibacillus sp. Marseille-P2973 TaxID=1871032 RepID=UPI001B365BC8|nr:flagellar filament capping protein FliD [Paenibacillus sp. Marseille-P2973]MBQ4900017.1 flagellar filament capping protein FliD [Paenibacillus sp. Marseille-P2973]